MPVVPSNKPQVQQNTLPAVRVQPVRSYDYSGQQMSQMGQSMQGAGRDFMKISLALQEQANNVRVNAEINSAKEFALDLKYGEDGYTKSKGLNVVHRESGKPFGDEYMEILSNRFADIEAGLGNDLQKNKFREWADSFGVGYKGELLQYEAQEGNAYALSTYRGTIATEQNMIVKESGNIDIIEGAAGRIEAANYEIGRLQGLSAAEIEAMSRKGSSGAFSLAIMSELEKGNVGLASAYFNRFASRMEPDDYYKIWGVVGSEIDNFDTTNVLREVVTSNQERLMPTTPRGRMNNIITSIPSRNGSPAFSSLSQQDQQLVRNFNFDPVMEQKIIDASGGDTWISDFLKAAVFVENRGFGSIRTDAVGQNANGTSDYGAFQMNTKTLQAYNMTPDDAMDFDKSLSAMVGYAREVKQIYNGNMDAALAHYNGGGRAGSAVMAGRTPSNSHYVNLARAYMGGRDITALEKQYSNDPEKVIAAVYAGEDEVNKAIEESEKKENEGRTWLEFVPEDTQTMVQEKMLEFQSGAGSQSPMTKREFVNAAVNHPDLIGRPRAQRMAAERAGKEWDAIQAERKQREEEATLEAMEALQANGGDYWALPIELRDRVPANKVSELIDYGAKANRVRADTNFLVFDDLSNDQTLLSLSDTEFQMALTQLEPSDKRTLITRRAELLGRRNGNPVDPSNAKSPYSLDYSTIDRHINDRLMSIGKNPGEKSNAEMVGRIKQQTYHRIVGLQAQLGRKLNDAEIMRELDQLMIERIKEGWIWDSKEPLVTASIKNISAEEKYAIRVELASQGIYDPTEAQMVSAWQSSFISGRERERLDALQQEERIRMRDEQFRLIDQEGGY